MPMSVTQPEDSSNVYGHPFRGKVDHTDQIAVDITALTDDEVDEKGYIKPGVPLRQNGTLVGGGGQVIHGVVLEAIKVADSNSAEDLAAASDAFELAIGTIGQVSRAVIEDNLERALTANELAAFGAAGCLVKLLQ